MKKNFLNEILIFDNEKIVSFGKTIISLSKLFFKYSEHLSDMHMRQLVQCTIHNNTAYIFQSKMIVQVHFSEDLARKYQDLKPRPSDLHFLAGA